jgi:hypothetical protein
MDAVAGGVKIWTVDVLEDVTDTQALTDDSEHAPSLGQAFCFGKPTV